MSELKGTPENPTPQAQAEAGVCYYRPTGWVKHPRKEWATDCGLKVIHDSEAFDGTSWRTVGHGDRCMKCKRKPEDAPLPVDLPVTPAPITAEYVGRTQDEECVTKYEVRFIVGENWSYGYMWKESHARRLVAAINSTPPMWMADSRPLLAEIESLAKQRDALLEAVTRLRVALDRSQMHFESIKLRLEKEDVNNGDLDAVYSEAKDGWIENEAALAILEAQALVGGGAK